MEIEFKRYIDWKVYSVTMIKNKFGFRILLIFDDDSKVTQQKSGFETKSIANKERDKIIADLYNGIYIISGNIKLKDFLEYWLEKIMRPEITNDSYVSYANAIRKHIIHSIGNLNISTLDQLHIRDLYNHVAQYSHPVAKIVKTIMKTSLDFAVSKRLIIINPAKDINLPKCAIEMEQGHELEINENKTLTLEQVKMLVKASKGTKIYLQVLFAVLMGLRRCEINGLKYSDIDYIHRKLKIDRQLGVVPNTKKEDFIPKTYTKQEIGLKTQASYRELDIPDIVFEAILEERKLYEQRKSRRINDKTNPFQDLSYICCSTYGRPRSKSYHWKCFKEILERANLPDIRWHDLRHTYSTLLMKNNFNLKDISYLLGHAKENITADIYGDKKQIILDCLDELEQFIKDVIPDSSNSIADYTDIDTDIIMEEYLK